MLGLINRGELEGSTEHEFENLTTKVNKLWLKEHNTDGTHKIDIMGVASAQHTHDAADIVSGTLDVARIPDLDAAKITTGTFADARLPAEVAYEDEANVFTQDQTISKFIPVLALDDTAGTAKGRLMALAGQTSLQYNLRWDGSWHSDDATTIGLRIRLEPTTGFVFYASDASATPTPVAKGQLKPDGTFDIEGPLVSASSITERNRSTPMGEWIPYTPTWTVTSGSAPSIGNGSLTAKYTLIGKTAMVWLQLIAGSTTTFGSGGEWIFNLPVSLLNGAAGSVRMTESGVANHVGVVQFTSATSFEIAVDNAIRVTNASPFAWGTNDSLNVSFFYEVA